MPFALGNTRTSARTALAALALIWASAMPGPAETVRLSRPDGAAMTARLAGDWSRCGPTLILSHGLGGDERALGWMDAPARAAGYRVLAMAHRASGPRALFSLRRRGAETVLDDPAIWAARAADLATALAFARRGGCRPDPLVLGGHSMGAAQTMMEAGARGTPPYRGRQRFDAYIAVSPQGPDSWAFARPDAWARVAAPVLMLTGTRDRGFGGMTPQSRIAAFDRLPPGRKRLGVARGIGHIALSRGGDAAQTRALRAITGEFLWQLRHGWAPSALDMPRSAAVLLDK